MLLLSVDETLRLSLGLRPQLLVLLRFLLRCDGFRRSVRLFSSWAALATRGCADDGFSFGVVSRRRRRFGNDALENRVEVG